MVQRGLIGAAMLLLGGGAGWVMHRSDYCLSGMFRDLFLFRSAFMLRTLALLVVAPAVLFEAAHLCGVLPRYPYPLLTPPENCSPARDSRWRPPPTGPTPWRGTGPPGRRGDPLAR
jgi:hypothetical protein